MQNQKFFKGGILVAMIAGFLMLSADASAQAIGNQFSTSGGQSIGQVAGNINSSLVGIQGLVEGFCYVAALFLVVMGILKFKAHKDDPRNTPLSTPIVIWVCGILFAFAPMLISTGAVTMWGSGGNVQSVNAPTKFNNF